LKLASITYHLASMGIVSMTKRRSIQDQLDDLIRDCGLSRYEIAKRTDVAQSALSRFVSGKRGLSGLAIDRLVLLFDIELVAHRPRPGKEKES
jgi:hypothetical protein